MKYLSSSLIAGTLVAVMMGLSGPAAADSDAEQLARIKDPNCWPLPGRDFALTRYSPLCDINTSNVHKLQMVWLQGTNALRGHEGQPLIISMLAARPCCSWSQVAPPCRIATSSRLSILRTRTIRSRFGTT